MKKVRSIQDKIKNIGLQIADRAKTTYKSARNSVERNLLKDSLRRRFNLENPYKFVIMENMDKAKLIDELLPKHAKRYIEDDIFVFYGERKDNDIKLGYIIKDLSDQTLYKVKEIVDVVIRVTLDDLDYDVDCIAVYGEML
jgi:hypothetical protein